VIGRRMATSRSSSKKATPRPTMSSCCVNNCRGSSRLEFAFLPADIVSQILNFGAPAPIDLQVRGANLEANFAYATSC